VGEWVPLVHRGDGAWMGAMPDGRIGSGVEAEGRASLEESHFIAMWPFMEHDLSECLGSFRRVWTEFVGDRVSSPERLIELTVETSWGSGRPYWMRCSAGWVVQMAGRTEFDPRTVRRTAAVMLRSDVLTAELRQGLMREVG
jgi:hypothetical protein